MDSITGKAREALRLPEDYGTDNEDEGETWGHIGVAYHRDSTPMDEAIFDGLYEEFIEKFPNDFQRQRAGHWGHGWMVEILVRVLKQAGEVTEDNITDAFKYCVERADSFDTVDFEDKIREYEHMELIENLMGSMAPSMVTIKSEADADLVSYWLWEHGIYPGGDDNTWFSDEEIILACYHLNLMDTDFNLDEWEEWEANHREDFEAKWRQRLENGGQLTLDN